MYKPEDESSDTQHPCKGWAGIGTHCNPGAQGEDIGDPWSMLAS